MVGGGARSAHKHQRARSAQHHRHDNAAQSDNGGGKAALFQLLDVGAQAAGEQDHDDAHLGKGVQRLHLGGGGVDDAPEFPAELTDNGGADEQARDDHAHHLGHAQPLGEHAEALSEQQDHRQVQHHVHYAEFHGTASLSGRPPDTFLPIIDEFSRKVNGAIVL